MNRSSEDMPIVRIGKPQPVNQVFIAGYNSIRRMLVHKHASPFQFFT